MIKFNTAVLVILTVQASAQKLPNVQEAAMRAPQNIKIDGKTSEWSNAFQAYNKATSVYYTLSNDDKYLYLILQSKDQEITNKIILGGVTFSVNTAGKKESKGVASITFPVIISRNKAVAFPVKKTGGVTGGGGSTAVLGLAGGAAGKQSPAGGPSKEKSDSIMYAMNRKVIDNLKDIRVTGIKEIKDTLISIYNEDDIKARALFDGARNYTYELSVPLSYLGLTVASLGEFAYHVKLNGVDMENIPMENITSVRVTKDASGVGSIQIYGPGGISYQSLMSATDFWGKYVLASKSPR